MPKIILPLLLAMATSPLPAESLAARLEARSEQAAGQLPADVRNEFAKGIAAVAESGILDRSKKTGDKAPDFALKNATGKEVRLSTLLKDGPVVLTWYRGGWCPYCNLALRALQEELPAFRQAGAQLVALTPELPDKSLDTTQKNELEFEVLTDLNHRVANDYGLAFKLTPRVREIYKEFFDLNEFNGEEAGDDTLPLAATYVIGTDGVIRWAFLDADYRKRAEPADITAFLSGNKDAGNGE